jgi:hypothetical protein
MIDAENKSSMTETYWMLKIILKEHGGFNL